MLTKGHTEMNYKTLNETPNAKSQQFFENQLSMCSHTDFVSVYLVDNNMPILCEKKSVDLSIFSV